MRALAVLVSVLAGLSCRGGSGPEADLAASRQGREEQLRHLLRDPYSPLAVAAGHFVADGDELELSRSCEPVTTGGAVRVAWPGGALTCVRGCGSEPQPITGTVRVDLDGCGLALSLQSGEGRVLVHRPELLEGRSVGELPHEPVAEDWILVARFEPADGGAEVPFATTRGASKALPLAGHLSFEREGRRHRLAAFGAAGEDGAIDAFVPFTDRTTGAETYPVGRYVNVTIPPGRVRVLLDFNQAYNPYCAYSEHYNCPIPPAGNALPFAVRAGERHLPRASAH